MSAALNLPVVWASSPAQAALEIEQRKWKEQEEVRQEALEDSDLNNDDLFEDDPETGVPPVCLAFYRKHTEKLLRRYLYASTQVGRAPSILGDPVGRGWASSRPVRSFEDAVIFVLDVESCISRLGALDQQLLGRIVLQEYTQFETAAMLGMSPRAVSYKFGMALDRLTEHLLAAKLLAIPD